MYSGKIQLTTQDILDKEFKIDANGYRRPEVDEFLDNNVDLLRRISQLEKIVYGKDE